MRARATATVTISADWTRKVVDSINEHNRGVLAVVGVDGKKLTLVVSLADLHEWVGIGDSEPTDGDEQEQLVQKVVVELLKPMSELPETSIEISDLDVG